MGGEGDGTSNGGTLRDGVSGTRRPPLAVALQEPAGSGQRVERVFHAPGGCLDPRFFEGGFDVRSLEPVLAQVLRDVLRDGLVDRLLGWRQRLPRPRERVTHYLYGLAEVVL